MSDPIKSTIPEQNVHYIMANIQVPMMRRPNGTFDSLSDHTTISFEIIDYLPSKSDYRVDNQYIKQKLNELFPEPPIVLRKPAFETSHTIALDEIESPLHEEEIETIMEQVVEPIVEKEMVDTAASTMRKLGETLLTKKANKKSKKEIKERSPSPDFKIKS